MADSKKPTKKASSNKTSVKSQKLGRGVQSGLESAFAARTADLEKGTREYNVQLKVLEKQLKLQQDIRAEILATKNLGKEQTDALNKATKKYVAHQKLQASLAQQVKDRVISEEQAKKVLNKSRADYDSMVRSAKLTGENTANIRKQLKGLSKEMQLSADAFDKTAKKAAMLNTALDQIGSSSIPMMREFSDVLKGIAERDLKAVTIALTAAGAAAALLAKNYFFPEMKAAQDVENEIKQMKTDNIAEIAKINNKYAFVGQKITQEINQNSIETANTVNRLNTEAAYASQRAANEFAATMKSGAAEFSAASKTAFFGKGLGSVGYSTAQLQLAGVSAEEIASSLSAASNAMGRNTSSEMAANMAVMSKRTGQSVENLSSINEYFMRTDKVSESSAMNMQEGLRAMADSAKVDLGGVMQEVAEASKEALGYQIKSGPALAKQVVYAKSLGVSFNDIAKAGKSMVLNYKDSIKNEMQLSAMLGRNVNLSEARSLFAQGKNDEALKSIQAQGLDPAKMNMFQQEALQQALGGLDLNSIQKISQNTGREGGALTQQNAKKGNKQFLQTNTNAQASLASQQANIQAQQAIIDAKLSGQITKAYLASDGYKKYQNGLIDQEKAAMKIQQAEELRFKQSKDYLQQLITTAKNNIENMFSPDNFKTMGVGLAGALAGNIVGQGIGKLVNGVQKVFVVNQDGGSDPTDLLDGPDSKSKSKTKTKTRTSRPRAPRGPKGKIMKIFNSASDLLPKMKNLVKPSSLLKGGKTLLKGALKGGVASLIGGYALDSIAESQAAKGNKKTAAAADIASAALSGAGYGAMLGSFIPGVGNVVGGAVGGVLGAGYGLYQNWGTLFPEKAKVKPKAPPKKAGATPANASTVVPGTGSTPNAQTLTLSDVQYQTRLQTKMVELLGVSATLLQYILLEDQNKQYKANEINSMRLSNQLMMNAKKQMAIARTETVGAYKGK